MVKIRPADGGYILETNSGQEKIFSSFDDLVQYLAIHFQEIGVGETWETLS